ncbi:hypothetical protein [Chryseobacterium schmidteae]|uniref:hypothetical protein n=1 Tax=Chryseobacterium schmidteae TaxID=2730404 RepID=UPI001588F355|nr:hypothetical protein [Chryseobacterium schmidteae]
MKTSILFKNLSSFLSVLFSAVFLLSVIRCTPPPPEPPVDDSYKKKLITHEEARVLFDEYSATNNKVLMDSRNGNPDSRWYWFSIEEMEGYIKYVKENAKEKNLQNVGIRIYMGKYPAKHPANKMAKPEYAGYQTVFLMPTTKTQTSENRKKRRGVADENEDIESIQPMNMTNLAPPPNALVETMN